MSQHMNTRPAAPEWVTTQRTDALVSSDTLANGWSVASGPLARGFASTDFGRCLMTVPAGDSPLAKAVRAHELIHASVSPIEVSSDVLAILGISHHAVALAEEVRVNSLLRSSMLTTDFIEGDDNADPGLLWKHLTDGSETNAAKIAVESGDWKTALNIFLATHNTGASRAVRRKVQSRDDWRDAFSEINNTLNDMVDWKDMFYWKRSTAPVEYQYLDRKRRVHTVTLPAGFVQLTLPLAVEIDRWLNDPPTSGGAMTRFRSAHEPGRGSFTGDWDRIRFGATRLTESTAKFIGRRRRPSITGKYPSRPDRLITDPERRIFREEVRGQGGIVVFDCSGSMSVHMSQVAAILNAYAGATIVAYANHSTVEPNAWILAQGGRRVSDETFHALPLRGGNGIDAPIVEWAHRQRKRGDFLIWVSDGGVTGVGDHTAASLYRDMARVITRRRVITVRRADDAVELVRRLKTGAAMPRGGNLTGCWAIDQHMTSNKKGS